MVCPRATGRSAAAARALRRSAPLGALALVLACTGGEPHHETVLPATAGTAVATERAAIDAIALAALAERRIPGLSIAVMRGDSLVHAVGYGLADSGRAATATTRYQLGSISKQFVAALVMRLVEREWLRLDESAAEALPGFGHLPREILVEHLLTHTSGIREPFTLPSYQDAIGDLTRTRAHFTAILREAPVDFAPATRWSYSNANYLLLALVAEDRLAMPYERALAAEFFTPLDLQSLDHCTPLPAHTEDARGHVLEQDQVVPASPENFHGIRGDGGLCGNAVDVARWTRALASARAVGEASYAAMRRPTRLADGRTADYGYGLSRVPLDGRDAVGHNGMMLGFSASAAYYPADSLTVVVLTNRGGVSADAIQRAISRSLLGLPTPSLAARPLSPRDAARYEGHYDIGVFTVEVARRDGRLWVRMPPPGPTSALIPLGADEFAGAEDPDVLQLRFDVAGGLARDVRVLMGGMHWYGTRRP